MCVGCAMAAAAGATGTRAWLQAHHMTWLTPRRMKAVTVGLCVVGFVVPSVTLSGSTRPPASHAAKRSPAAAHVARLQ